MTTHAPGTATAASAELDGAPTLGSDGPLLATSPVRPPVPTFAEYIPLVSAAVTDGTRRVYGSYWNRVLDHWGHRHLDKPTPSEIKELVEHPTPLEIKQLCENIKGRVVTRKDDRRGRSATEHLSAALRCLYRHATADGLIADADNPALHVANPEGSPAPAAPSTTTD